MMTEDGRLFDFATYRPAVNEYAELVRRFAGHDALRSARVEELVLDGDFHRRAARPEDLEFIDLSNPVRAGTVTCLAFLATQRLLHVINELGIVRLARDGGALPRSAAFQGAAQRLLGAEIRGFLESFAFDFVEGNANIQSPADVGMRVEQARDVNEAFWVRVGARLSETGYLAEGVRFISIQNLALAPCKRQLLARAAAAGFFDALPNDARPRLGLEHAAPGQIARVSELCGVTRAAHSYWQFYLSTSLASCNLIGALAERPEQSLSLCGAAFVLEAEWLAFDRFLTEVGPRLGIAEEAETAEDRLAACWGVAARARAAAEGVRERYGQAGFMQFVRGMRAAEALGVAVRRNLGEQIHWLSALDKHQKMAALIHERILSERPDIDRETFVEPREMCSTTHVHDDHRLVVIESGKMVFWGNLGMSLRLDPGEMILVPQGRLHGSSIDSATCTYHQPIIPPDWIQSISNEIDPPFLAD
jgi:hypothetical protein